MAQFEVHIPFESHAILTVEADNHEDALNKAREKFENTDPSDLVCGEFQSVEDDVITSVWSNEDHSVEYF